MAFDSQRNRTVLFGGYSFEQESEQNDTWEYDGADWTLRNTPVAPPPRDSHAMAFDEVRQAVVLFGGYRNSISTASNETWEWDGTEWTLITPVTSPPARHAHAMTFDRARGEIVMLGGYPTGPSLGGITWIWDGVNWTQRAQFPTVPTGDFWNSSLVLDASRGEAILYGGKSGTEFLDATWGWNGTNWSQRTVGNIPPARNSHGMAFDEARGEIVMFGGSGAQPRYADTWIWNGSSWSGPIVSPPAIAVFDMSSRESGIWNFTTIDLPSGITVQFNKNTSNTPVIWLATGEVNIAGGIDLDGEDGFGTVTPGDESPGGPGGFAGGLGGRRFEISGSYAGTPGQGPGGGFPGTIPDEPVGAGNGSYGTKGTGSGASLSGEVYGNRYIQPLLGGSGGGGGRSANQGNGGNGGGGGGGLLIASSDLITLNGSIHANGGEGGGAGLGGPGGNGSGGGIRLAAPMIEGTGSILAVGGSNTNGQGGDGRIRLDGFDVSPSITSSPPASFGPPISTGLENQATIVITQVAGAGVPANPTGNLASPDVIFTETGSVTVDLQTTNIPVGSDLTVRITASGQELLETATVGPGGSAQTVFPMVPAGVGTVQAYAEFAAP
ncbi:MAG: hypothetical protein HUU16_00600 [Candidatus Omnitrophica bacterium]|nr:hypothetical protein [Candidatus Omnitrophota bacterium]